MIGKADSGMTASVVIPPTDCFIGVGSGAAMLGDGDDFVSVGDAALALSLVGITGRYGYAVLTGALAIQEAIRKERSCSRAESAIRLAMSRALDDFVVDASLLAMAFIRYA